MTADRGVDLSSFRMAVGFAQVRRFWKRFGRAVHDGSKLETQVLGLDRKHVKTLIPERSQDAPAVGNGFVLGELQF